LEEAVVAKEAHRYIGIVPADEFPEVADTAGLVVAPVHDLIIRVRAVGVVKVIKVHMSKVIEDEKISPNKIRFSETRLTAKMTH
jgi:hypothetical protein